MKKAKGQFGPHRECCHGYWGGLWRELRLREKIRADLMLELPRFTGLSRG